MRYLGGCECNYLNIGIASIAAVEDVKISPRGAHDNYSVRHFRYVRTPRMQVFYKNINNLQFVISEHGRSTPTQGRQYAESAM
jgi:hypothetical protein